MEATIEKKAEKVQARKPTGKIKQADYERNTFFIGIDPGVDLEDVQKPEFWAHVAAQLKPNDRIEVIPDDFAWFAELIVIGCDRTWAKTALLRFVELTGPAVEVPASLLSGYRVEYKGPTKKHVVIRVSDKTIVQEGIALKADAEAWIKGHVQALAR